MSGEETSSKRLGMTWDEPLIFERSRKGRPGLRASRPDVEDKLAGTGLPAGLARKNAPRLPEVTERDAVQHFTRLSTWNFGLDHGFYPLGSCTMKYNPKINEALAALPGLRDLHPAQSPESVPGALRLMLELKKMLEEISGMAHVCLQPAAGAQGELTGMLMVRAYHEARGGARKVVLIPDTAHGTNPASSALAGYEVKEIPTAKNGVLEAATVRENLSEDVAALMMTNPNTLGLFETNVAEIADALHEAGALLYCDGANLNAIMGITRPGDMGVDVIQLNLHKTFSTPHGGGGPGAGPVGVCDQLAPFLPAPVLAEADGRPVLQWERPLSIGKVTAYYGHFLIMVRAYAYLLSLGPEGVRRAAALAVLNANYIRACLKDTYHLPHPDRCMHEVVFSDKGLPNGVITMDVAKRLMDYGFHPPTIYFPLVVHGSLMIEPTETESRETLDRFIAALTAIAAEAASDPDAVKGAPCSTPLSRLDEVRAARKPVLRYRFPGDAGE
ncbi:MAG TPA: aminomethyl-transferring glycine dehydrogenase subunit GcvPB [bacterium]|nr:aminomethyl-transferring glycine dehydrogenase subunit GcvPB [bacterium]